MDSESSAVTLLVTNALESLNVAYVIGGSLASALHGVARSTLDADIVADLRPGHVEPFVQMLGGHFYVDAESAHQAIERRSSFNLIHLETMFKVDIFIPKQRVFDRAQLQRGSYEIIATDPERAARVASLEDTIIAKLEWYRLGGETSERQWRDVLGVLQAGKDNLDRLYLQQTAAEVGVADLLQHILSEAGQAPDKER